MNTDLAAIVYDDAREPDKYGRRAFSMYWRTANNRNRGQCFFAVPANYMKPGVRVCADVEEAFRYVGWTSGPPCRF